MQKASYITEKKNSIQNVRVNACLLVNRELKSLERLYLSEERFLMILYFNVVCYLLIQNLTTGGQLIEFHLTFSVD